MMFGTYPILAQAADETVTLTAAGTVVMTLSIALVLTLMAICMYRLLREPRASDRHHAPLEIDTKDLD